MPEMNSGEKRLKLANTRKGLWVAFWSAVRPFRRSLEAVDSFLALAAVVSVSTCRNSDQARDLWEAGTLGACAGSSF